MLKLIMQILVRSVVVAVLFVPAGCRHLSPWPGTDVEFAYNPETRMIEGGLQRDWLSGPFEVDVKLKIERPDGTKVTLDLSQASDANTDNALQAFVEGQKNLGKALDMVGAGAKAAGGP